MDAVVLFSHGSLLCGSGVALQAHAARLRRRRGRHPGRTRDVRIVLGYLNYGRPLFPETVHRLVAGGVTRIVVIPYFLDPGYFVTAALPEQLAQAREEHPHVQLAATQPIGYDQSLVDAVIDSARSAVDAAGWDMERHEAARRCERRDTCPMFQAANANCPAPSHAPAPTPAVRPPPDPQRPGTGWALLVMAHGSPDFAANADMLRVVEGLRRTGRFSMVQPAFLDCNQPDIPAAIVACVRRGAARVVAVPYFLHTGKHVACDLPAILRDAMLRHPRTGFRLGTYIGRSPRVTDILQARLEAALQ